MNCGTQRCEAAKGMSEHRRECTDSAPLPFPAYSAKGGPAKLKSIIVSPLSPYDVMDYHWIHCQWIPMFFHTPVPPFLAYHTESENFYSPQNTGDTTQKIKQPQILPKFQILYNFQSFTNPLPILIYHPEFSYHQLMETLAGHFASFLCPQYVYRRGS